MAALAGLLRLVVRAPLLFVLLLGGLLTVVTVFPMLARGARLRDPALVPDAAGRLRRAASRVSCRRSARAACSWPTTRRGSTSSC
jgi:hypothetical protein